MLDHAAFSALRLRHLFPIELLNSFPAYYEVRPDAHTFDIEIMGGQWDVERIDGVVLWFPQVAPDQVGMIELSAGPHTDGLPEIGKTPGFAGRFIEPGWSVHADAVLAALGSPLRIGADAASVHRIAAGRVLGTGFPDVARKVLSFASRLPTYHMQAIVHDSEGLVRLVVRRPDLVRANDAGDGYDLLTANLHDEGSAEPEDTARDPGRATF